MKEIEMFGITKEDVKIMIAILIYDTSRKLTNREEKLLAKLRCYNDGE